MASSDQAGSSHLLLRIDDAFLDRLVRVGILQGPRLRARHASGPRSKLEIRRKKRTAVRAVRGAEPPENELLPSLSS